MADNEQNINSVEDNNLLDGGSEQPDTDGTDGDNIGDGLPPSVPDAPIVPDDIFFSVYPEFIGKVTLEQVEAVRGRIYVLFPVLHNGKTQEQQIAACMVIAHFFARSAIIAGNGQIGAGAGGVVSSASIGGVSVSLMGMPIKDMTEYFFASTPYGQEFLMWLSTIGGCCYVN